MPTPDPNELTRLNAVAGRYDGIYASHVRNRDSGLLEAIDEFLAVAHVVEDPSAKDETAAIYPDISVASRAQPINLTLSIHFYEMEAESRSRRNEAGNFAAALECIDHRR